MKRYLQKSLLDMFQMWVALEVGIIISAILYAVLRVEGISENTSLVIAFILLVGFIVAGLGFFPLSTSSFVQALKKWSLGEQKQDRQLEGLVVEQNLLLERLSRNIESLAQNIASGTTSVLASDFSGKSSLADSYLKRIAYISEPEQERLANTILPSFEKFGRSVDQQTGKFEILVDKQETVFKTILESQRREQAVLENLANNIAAQQTTLEQVLTMQKESLEQPTAEQLKEQAVEDIINEIGKLPARQREALLTAFIRLVGQEPYSQAGLSRTMIKETRDSISQIEKKTQEQSEP
jgi:hypothetical protein